MFLGFDIGSSSVKVSLIKGDTGECIATAFSPKQEMAMKTVQIGWAEQSPEMWWENLKIALQEVLHKANCNKQDIKAIGISYQMHGLVVVDKNQEVLRPSIIWCDSRATEIGRNAFETLGSEKCLSHLLNTPGNFTASKLKWVKENEPKVYEKIHKIMLPGDYIAMRLSGEIQTTVSGLSEGMMWDFKDNSVASMLLNYYGIDKSLIPEITPTFSKQSLISKAVAEELDLPSHIVISYRAGDQPNNALSLNVLNPGEVATTAGTSGVVYGISEKVAYDPKSRVNTFAHVNHTKDQTRLGVLLCINGTGILNSWMQRQVGQSNISYNQMNELSAKVPIGSDGLSILPFGNGAERVLQDVQIGSHISNLNFNTHTNAHLFRAAHEGIAFSFQYGMEIMKTVGIEAKVIRAGNANMFLSPVFRQTIAGVSGAQIELYNTDGSIGAARGAAIGYGFYSSPKEAFVGLKRIESVEPDNSKASQYKDAYELWKLQLDNQLQNIKK